MKNIVNKTNTCPRQELDGDPIGDKKEASTFMKMATRAKSKSEAEKGIKVKPDKKSLEKLRTTVRMSLSMNMEKR